MVAIEHTSIARLPNALIAALKPSRKVVLPVLLMVLFLGAWELVAQAGIVSKLVLAGPSAIALAMIREAGPLASNTGITLAQALIGFVIGNIAGLMVAIAFVHSDLARRTIYPLAIGAEAVPVVAVLPVLILWLGNGMEPKIFITAFLTFFPMLVNAFRGLRSADAEVNELLYTLSASSWQRLVMVRLPASVPFLFNALKLSACGSVVARGRVAGLEPGAGFPDHPLRAGLPDPGSLGGGDRRLGGEPRGLWRGGVRRIPADAVAARAADRPVTPFPSLPFPSR